MSSTTNTTTSDQSSILSDTNKDNLVNSIGGFMPMFNNNMIIERLPMLDNGGGFFNNSNGGSCFFQNNNNNNMGSSVDNNNTTNNNININSDGFYIENNGVFGIGSVNINGELFVPPLESVSTITNHSVNLKLENHRDTNINTITSFFDINNHKLSAENNVRSGVENLFQEELTLGEWDLEDLMKDVSSFPFLDFSS